MYYIWQHYKTPTTQRAKATATRDLGDLGSKDCLRVKGLAEGVLYFVS